MNENKTYNAAIKFFGEAAQINMLFEEMAELQKAVCKLNRALSNNNIHLVVDFKNDIAEEIADVEIMLGQMKILFDIENKVKGYKKYKLERLQELISGGAS